LNVVRDSCKCLMKPCYEYMELVQIAMMSWGLLMMKRISSLFHLNKQVARLLDNSPIGLLFADIFKGPTTLENFPYSTFIVS
jgi:hypothetical protein